MGVGGEWVGNGEWKSSMSGIVESRKKCEVGVDGEVGK